MTRRRRQHRQRPTAHCCLTPARLERAPGRSPTSSPSRMPRPSCDQANTSLPSSLPHLLWRAADPRGVLPTARTLSREWGLLPWQRQGGYLIPVLHCRSRPAPGTQDDVAAAMARMGVPRAAPLSTGLWMLAPAPGPLQGGGGGAEPCSEATVLAHAGASSAALPHFSTPGAVQSTQLFLL